MLVLQKKYPRFESAKADKPIPAIKPIEKQPL